MLVALLLRSKSERGRNRRRANLAELWTGAPERSTALPVPWAPRSHHPGPATGTAPPPPRSLPYPTTYRRPAERPLHEATAGRLGPPVRPSPGSCRQAPGEGGSRRSEAPAHVGPGSGDLEPRHPNVVPQPGRTNSRVVPTALVSSGGGRPEARVGHRVEIGGLRARANLSHLSG